MATVTLNPVVHSIHGRIGNLVFYNRMNKTCMRSYVIPRNPDTEAQRIIRGTFAEAVKTWQAMTEADKQNYYRKAKQRKTSGYNLFISEYMKMKISQGAELQQASMKEGIVLHRNTVYTTGVELAFSSVSTPYMLYSIDNTRLSHVPGGFS